MITWLRRDKSRTPCPIRMVVMLFVMLFGLASTTNASKGIKIATLADHEISYRQDFCSRYQEMLKEGGNFSMKQALSGTELRVLLVKDDLFFRYDESTGIDPDYPGFTAEILDGLAEKGNFTWRNSFAVTEYNPDTYKELYTNIEEFLVWGVDKYDIIVGHYAQSPTRMNLGIDIIEGIYDGSLLMVEMKYFTEDGMKFFGYLRPFEYDVWCAIIAVIVFSAICHRFIEVLGGQYDSNVSFRTWAMDNLYLSFLNFTGNYEYEPKSLGGRVYGCFCAFWALLITAAYTANLASFYILESVAEAPLASLQEAIDKDVPICVANDTYQLEYMETKYPNATNFVKFNGVLGNGSGFLDWTGPLQNDGCEAVVMPNFRFETLNSAESSWCSRDWQHQEIFEMSHGFAIKLDRESSCPNIVNWVSSAYLRELKEEGFVVEKWKQHKDFQGSKGHCEEESRRIHRRLETSERQLGGRGRRLSSTSKGAAAAGGAVTESAATGTDDSTHRLTLKEIGGTLLFQVLGSLFAVLLALLGKYEGNKSGRNNRKRNQAAMTALPSRPNASPDLTLLTQTISELKRDLELRDAQREQSLNMEKIELAQTIRELKRGLEQINRIAHAVSTEQSSNIQNGETGIRDSWGVESSTSIVFDSGDTNNCNSTTMGLGTFHSHLSSQCPQTEGKEGT